MENISSGQFGALVDHRAPLVDCAVEEIGAEGGLANCEVKREWARQREVSMEKTGRGYMKLVAAEQTQLLLTSRVAQNHELAVFCMLVGTEGLERSSVAPIIEVSNKQGHCT